MKTGLAARGFTLVELMIAMALGLVVVAGILTVFLALGQVSTTALSQASIQNAQNTISAILSPTLRGAGFGGCGSLTKAYVSTINAPGPLVNIYNLPVQGYDFKGTGGTGALTIAADNAANEPDPTKWAPALDGSFATAGIASEPGNDVLVVSGAMPGTAPAGVNTIDDGADAFTVTDTPMTNVSATLDSAGLGNGLAVPAALSDCGKSVVFMATAVSGSGTGVIVTHETPANLTATFAPSFPPGVQFVPLQQAAFYVADTPAASGESALYKAVHAGGTWVSTPIVPGVENMQVLYGVTSNGSYQWLPADAVATGPGFGVVTAVRIGFLIAGNPGSSKFASQPPFDVLGTMVTVPADTRLRHVFVMTVNLRNASL